MSIIRAVHYASGRPVQIRLAQQKIAAIEDWNCDPAQLTSLPMVAPGLFDIQINGYHGLWFCSETLTTDHVHRIVRSLANCGLPRFFPTLITCSFDAMRHGVATIRDACEQDSITKLAIRGIHLEGPSISAQDGPRGAHPLRHVRAARFEEFEKWQAASGGLIRLVTLAPEADGAVDFIKAAVASGVTISVGHTAASVQQINEAVHAGATLSTHLGNGCLAEMNRHRNIFWPQLADDRLTASIIADGHHVPDDMLNCIVRCKTLKRLILTCDVSGFGGCLPGRYAAGGVDVEVLDDGRIVVAGQREFLAGSGATTGDCVSYLMTACRLSLEDAWQLASARPAAMFGEPLCQLEAGQRATLTLFHLRSAAADSVRFVPVAAYADGHLISDHYCWGGTS